MPGSTLRRWIYWLWSRSARWAYARLPIFGPLRSSIAIIERGSSYLVIDRNDRLGYSFPGGIASGSEPDIETVRRELLEETGLILIDAEELFRFQSNIHVPAVTTVFRATVKGSVRASWEGTPCWFTLEQLESKKFFAAQQPVITYLKKLRTSPTP